MQELKLNPYRFFDSDPEIRKIAMELYSTVKDLPIVCPHGHVDPSYLAENKSYPDPDRICSLPGSWDRHDHVDRQSVNLLLCCIIPWRFCGFQDPNQKSDMGLI